MWILTLLKRAKREVVIWMNHEFHCPACSYILNPMEKFRFCPKCGKALSWKGTYYEKLGKKRKLKGINYERYKTQC